MAIAERFQGANVIDAGRLSPYWGEHAARYSFALPFVENRLVLDIACGTGYGIALLKSVAKHVTGVDVDPQTVANVVAIPVQSVTVRAAGGKTSEQLQEQKAKEAKERSGNELEVSSERQDARRTRDLLQRVVFVKHGDTVAMVPVETGIADNTHIQIKKGVKAGDEVVAGSYAAISRNLKDGAKVMLEKPKKEEAPK